MHGQRTGAGTAAFLGITVYLSSPAAAVAKPEAAHSALKGPAVLFWASGMGERWLESPLMSVSVLWKGPQGGASLSVWVVRERRYSVVSYHK